ncbi:MAG: hypothetical protein WAT35_12900 [Tabrizicola sp.]|jgi:uncharacterized membrane protein|uniref:hypothetical protein n=1 Tax=Tabrizicola sp. TaxID=2005166 RepID=UPI003BAF2F9D
MDAYVLARVLHVLAVIHWIGGVAMVTLVILPQMRALPPADRIATFERLEGRFGGQAKLSVLVAGLSGLWMLWLTDGWALFLEPAHWWLHLMVTVWAVFTLVLFVLEPLVLHRWFHARASRDPEGTFALVLRLHRGLLALSALAVAGAVQGAHGGLI